MKFKIHPLFLLVGLISAFTGDLLVFCIATLCAVQHECAHSFSARRVGFALDKIVLMPYGAVVSGDLAGISPKEELAILVAGPLTNACTALAFLALWWLFPESYPYTESAFSVSLSLFLVNILPAYPLDGGRALRVALRPLGERRARVICATLSYLLAGLVLGYFVWSCFSVPNLSAFFFALMLLFGGFGGGKYQRVKFSREKSLLRGVEELRIAISASRPLSAVLRFLREDKYLVLLLFEGEEFSAEVTEEELFGVLEEGDFHRSLKECFIK